MSEFTMNYLAEQQDLDYLEEQESAELSEIVLTYRSQNASED
jgi:hypothetical protein